MRVTQKDIQQVLNQIAFKEGKSFSRGMAMELHQDSYYAVDYASIYGGYRIVDVKVDSGAHWGTFGESSMVSRRKAKDMLTFLQGILYGLNSSK